MTHKYIKKFNSIFFRLSSCEELGLINAICTGQFGTLEEFLLTYDADYRFLDGQTLLLIVSYSQYLTPEQRLEVFRILKSAQVSIDLPSTNGVTPLMFATGSGEKDFCLELISAGAKLSKLDRNGDNALIWACSTNKLEQVGFLNHHINHRNKDGRTALMYVARNGNLSILKELLELGADYHIADLQGNNALNLACTNNHSEILKHLLNIDSKLIDSISLIQASAVGLLDIVNKNLSAKPNLLERNDNQLTALELATVYGHKNVVATLLPYYDDYLDIKSSALGCATLAKNLELLQIILASNVNIDYQDEIGDTALMHATRVDFAEAIELFIRHNANIKLINLNNENALDIAQKNNSYNALKVIFRYL